MVNYGIAYGLSAYGLADRLNIEQDEAGAYIDRYFERFPAVKRYIEETIEFARENGYVETLLGRRRPIPELRSGRPQVRSQGERLAVNMPIQGTSADIIKIAMVQAPSAPSPSPTSRPVSSSRSTTSSSSRAPPTRWRPPPSWSSAR